MNRRAFFMNLSGAAVGLAALGSVSSAWEADGSRNFKNISAAERRRKRFLNVELCTHEGQEVRFYDDLIKGKTVLINFMYTVCKDEAVCPLMTANLVQVQKALGSRMGRDIFIYSITLDPDRDTPEALKRYAELFRVKPGWLFLTGKRDDIEKLRRNLGFADSDPLLDKDRSQHIGVVRFGIEPLDRWAMCPALTKPQSIARHIAWMEPKGARPKGRLNRRAVS